METKLTEVQRRVFEVGVKPQICYQQWVDEVCAFLKTTAPYLGEGGRHCSVFQSKPVLNIQPDILFLGYNANEDYGYAGIERKRDFGREICLFMRKEQDIKIPGRCGIALIMP